MLKEILQDYNESTIISLIIKSLNHSSNIYSKNDMSQDFPQIIHIDKNTNSLEILNSIIEDLLSIKQRNEKSYKKNLIKINVIVVASTGGGTGSCISVMLTHLLST